MKNEQNAKTPEVAKSTLLKYWTIATESVAATSLSKVVLESSTHDEGIKSTKQIFQRINSTKGNGVTFSESLCERCLELQYYVKWHLPREIDGKCNGYSRFDKFRPSSLALENCGVCHVTYQAIESMAFSKLDELWYVKFDSEETFRVLICLWDPKPPNRLRPIQKPEEFMFPIFSRPSNYFFFFFLSDSHCCAGLKRL